MAISPIAQYPTKMGPVVPLLWPYGEPRNIAVPGDATGTPWEAAVVKDIMGFQQAMLSDSNAAIVPSGTPEQANDSQYLQALKKILRPSGMEFRARLSSGSTTVIDISAGAEIIFNDDSTGELFDLDNVYDNTTGRFTPTVAGYYEVGAILQISNGGDSYTFNIEKAFSTIIQYRPGMSPTSDLTGHISTIIHMNGTTDYLHVRNGSGSSALRLVTDFVGAGTTDFFGKLLRAD